MNKKLLQDLQQKLEEEKENIEKELRGFAKEDPKSKGDWNTRFPKFDGGTGGQMLEDAAAEVEEYSTRLPIEYSLELRLRDINLALEKIGNKKQYGICEKCGKKIAVERLKVYPEARLCLQCGKQ